MKKSRLFGNLIRGLLFTFIVAGWPAPLPAQGTNRPAAGTESADKASDAGKKDESKADKEPRDKISSTTNTVTIGGQEIRYRATAGTIVMKDEEDKPRATVFFIAYTKLGGSETNPAARPITFSFNGGPGSSSVWLHLGALGPRRVWLEDDGGLPPPPYRLVDNEYSLLDESDLVFIDPVSTGYSRPAAGEDPKKFHGVQEDLESVGDFIRLYTTRYERWASPKFLIGESYGTTRAAGLSGYLEDRYGIYLNGIGLISSVLDFSTISFNSGNDLPCILYLPSETAAAWYHKKLPADLQSGDLKRALAESEQFALGDYAHALTLGAGLPAADRQRIVQTLARLTGLSADFVDRSDLRINAGQFFKELLRNERLTIGRYDARRTGTDRNSVGEGAEYDPSYTSVLGPFTATLNDYVRRDLKFDSDLPYEILTGKVQPWDYSVAENRYLDVAETLRKAMTHNPYLKVFAASGYYDMATPYLSTRYTFDHIGLPPDLRSNITLGYYEAGHMMYVNRASLAQLKHDLAGFVRSAAFPPPR
jgi:carboxypeptidase C (cathepsin A)